MAPEKQEGQNSKKFSFEISAENCYIGISNCSLRVHSDQEQIYDELENKESTQSIVKGIFLYTDEDRVIAS